MMTTHGFLDDLSTTGTGRRGPSLRRVSVSQQIHEALRERIVTLDLLPGQGLSRLDLAEEYGVSQTPVRDAMMKLAEEGLLVIYPQSRTLVTKIDVAHARETQFLRLALELEVCRRLALAPDSVDLSRTAAILDRQRAAQGAGDLVLFSELDRDFHRSLFAAAGVEQLADLVASRSGHIDRLRKLDLPEPGKAADIMDYHGRIVAAIRAGDAGAAERNVRGHLSGTLAKIAEIVARHPEYF